MVRRILVFSNLLCAICFAEVFAEPIIARVNDWPPMYYRENGKWVGMAIDFHEALAGESGVRVVFHDLPWSRAMEGLKKGRNCHIIAGITPTEERAGFMHFIGPHYSEVIGFVLLEKNKHINICDFDQLAAAAKESGLRIGIQTDVFYSEAFHKKLNNDPDFASHFYSKSDNDNYHDMVKMGRLFGYFETIASVMHSIKTNPEYKGLAVHSFPISIEDVYFGVSKQGVDAETLKKLRDANKKLLENGTYKTIDEKWKNQAVSPAISRE